MARYGLLGETLGHSYSPEIHRLLVGYDYDLCPTPPEAVEDFVRHSAYEAFNVTIPYKKTVVPYCDELSPTAQRLGSVNTITRSADGRILGDNTDYFGFRWLLEHAGIDPAGGKCLILGSGGSAVTVRAVLEDLCAAEIVIISRSGENNYTNLDRHADAAVIVNTTPVGMYPNNDDAPLSLEGFPALRGVVDIIYNPARTRLLQQAADMGIPCVNGLAMLVAQAHRAAELFTGETLNPAKIPAVTAQIDAQDRNIALIGMPGSGKSTTGKALAKALGREFIDLDEELVRRAGRSIPDIFAADGEAVFRQMETEVVRDVCRGRGLVIATGGGVVTQERNRYPLRQNSHVVFLRQPDLSALPTEGRPLSQSGNLSEMAKIRLPLYNAWCDVKADAIGVDATVAMIREALGL